MHEFAKERKRERSFGTFEDFFLCGSRGKRDQKQGSHKTHTNILKIMSGGKRGCALRQGIMLSDESDERRWDGATDARLRLAADFTPNRCVCMCEAGDARRAAKRERMMRR